jgi:hypothetical protein
MEAQMTLTEEAARYDEAGAIAQLLANTDFDAAGDNLVERIVLAVLANNPGTAEDAVRAAVYAHWMF